MRDTHDCYITSLERFFRNVLDDTNVIIILHFLHIFSIYTAILNIHWFFFPLVYVIKQEDIDVIINERPEKVIHAHVVSFVLYLE